MAYRRCLREEEPLYRKGMTATAFRQHKGELTSGPNWLTFFNFADRYLISPAGAAVPIESSRN
jgi:hypothetical protein